MPGYPYTSMVVTTTSLLGSILRLFCSQSFLFAIVSFFAYCIGLQGKDNRDFCESFTSAVDHYSVLDKLAVRFIVLLHFLIQLIEPAWLNDVSEIFDIGDRA